LGIGLIYRPHPNPSPRERGLRKLMNDIQNPVARKVLPLGEDLGGVK